MTSSLPRLQPSRFSLVVFVVLAAFTGAPRADAAAPLAPSHLTVNYASEPVGTDSSPFFGWQVNDPDANEVQSRYQLRVGSSASELAAGRADVWDSGQRTSRQQSQIAYEGPALAANGEYFWQVRTWDEAGNPGPFSAPTRFVVGPLTTADWAGASWVRRTTDDADDYTYYRRALDLPNRSVRRATAYVTGVHKYELYLNGERVGDGPAYQYPQHQYYNGFDITSLVRPGTNVFAMFNHWFGGGQGRATSARGILMKAVIHYVDGSTVVVGTDGNWKQLQAPQWVLGQRGRNPGEGVGFIERIDGRRILADWNQPGFDDSSWSAVDVIGPVPTDPWVNAPQPDLTRIVQRELTPVSITPLVGVQGGYMVDLGKVHAGMPRVTFTGGNPGDLVTMRGGYMLGDDGKINPRGNQNTDLSFFAELNGDTFTYAPTEYIGLRYIQVENSPMPVTPENFKFIERFSWLDESLSSFESSDRTLNDVWSLMKRSLIIAAHEEYVDTPSREKGGFLGDAAIMSTVSMPVYGERLLTHRQFHEYLTSMEQFWSTPETNRGRINAVYPNNDRGRDIPDYTQAFLLWVWDYYMETGDRAFLETHYDKLRMVAEYVHRSHNPETGLITDLPGGGGAYVRGIIDWPASMRYGYDMRTAGRAVINHWAYGDFVVMSRIAGALGQAADRDLYQQRAEALKTAINSRLINADGVYIDGLYGDGTPSPNTSQHANMFPLSLGFVPDAHRASVINHVKELQMRVGMVTVLHLVRGIGEAGEGEHLIDLFTDESWGAGWAHILALGATSTWETWEANVDGQSQSHAWGAAGLDGYVRYILGIRPSAPGYEQVQVKPLDFGNRLPWARGSIATDRGPIGVSWVRSDERYAITVNLPANATSQVHVPKGSASNLTVRVNGNEVAAEDAGDTLRVALGSGTHTVERTLTP